MSTSETWILATHNPGKIKELVDILEPHGIAVQSAAEVSLPEPIETEPDFAGNAALKARAACEATGKPCLADDSGLSVDALDGAPGIYSARWAGQPRDFDKAMQRVATELEDKPGADRTAHFVCVIALARPDQEVQLYEGRITGQIVWPPRGEGGFGYDAIFQPDGESRTFAEMSLLEKRQLSHRGRALERLIDTEFSK